MKWCSRCKQELPIDRFSSRKNGVQSYCKGCQSAYTQVYYAKDKVGFTRIQAVSLFRRFRDDPEFWQRVEALDSKAAHIGSRVQPRPNEFVN